MNFKLTEYQFQLYVLKALYIIMRSLVFKDTAETMQKDVNKWRQDVMIDTGGINFPP